jgi:hypothetical protein
MHQELEVNILALFVDNRRVVLVAIDALFVGSQLSAEIVKACDGIDPAAIVIVASHTHSSPALETTKPLLGEGDSEHIATVRDRIVKGVRATLAASPVRGSARHGHRKLDAGMNRRRRWPLPRITSQGIRFDRVVMAPNKRGRTDPTATVTVIEGADQRAVIWHYACHPTDFPDDFALSADYPGVVRAALREKYGPQTAVLFLQGFAGDIRPPGGRRRWIDLPRSALVGPRFGAMTYGEWHAWSAKIASGIAQACDSAELALDETLRASSAQTPLSTLLEGAPETRTVEVQRLCVLGRDILVVSAEPLIGLQDACPADCLCVGYSRDVFGYWPTAQDIPLGGYEVEGYKELFSVQYPWCDDPDSIFKRLVHGTR